MTGEKTSNLTLDAGALAVRPAHTPAQGAGVGRGLLREAARWAVRDGADRLVLDTLHAAMPAAAACTGRSPSR